MKIVILGDSISQGIGTKKINYVKYLEESIKLKGIECKIINLAMTGTTIVYAKNILDKIKIENPDLVIIMYGSVEAQIRPNIDKNRFHLKDITPSRYKNIGGMLDPRALYSSKLTKRMTQYLDNIYRKFWKLILVKTQGVYQKLNKEMFNSEYNELLKELTAIGTKIICVSTIYIDDYYFLNSSKEYVIYNKIINDLAIKFDVKYVDVYSRLEKEVVEQGWKKFYTADHFHPNVIGLELIAKLIAKEVY